MATLSLNERSLREQLEDRRARLRSAIGGSPHPRGFQLLLEEVDAALRQVDDGSYGLCVACREPVEPERLAADPLIRNCLSCLTPAQQRDLEHDLDRAGQIQSALLPPRDLIAPGWEIHYRYEPAGAVSGDFCDVIPPAAAGDDVYFFLGDISGKGISASILMSHLQATFRGLVGAGGSLAEIVAAANRMFCNSTLPSHYATVVAGRADRSGEIEIVNAGHCAPLVVSGGRATALPSNGLPVGMFSSGAYTPQTVRLGRGESIVLYTDGLAEARNERTEEYGSKRIASQLAHREGARAVELARACIEGARAFHNGTPRDDDLTVMVVRYCGNASGAVSM